jgi:hypothetical protein
MSDVCSTCNGKGFVWPDGTADNAFEGSDYGKFMDCPDCVRRGQVICRECGGQTKAQAHCEFCGERP